MEFTPEQLAQIAAEEIAVLRGSYVPMTEDEELTRDKREWCGREEYEPS